MLLKRVCVVVLSLCLPTAVRGQVGIKSIPSGTALTNAFPIDFLVLTYAPSGKSFATVRVPANAHRPSTAGTEIVNVEPLSLEVGVPEGRLRLCSAVSTPQSGPDVQTLLAEFKALEVLETSSAKERLQAASARARIEAQQQFDVMKTSGNDPLRNELQRLQVSFGKSPYQFTDADLNTMEQVAGDLTATVMAWAAASKEKLRMLYDETKTLEPVVKQAKLAYKIKQEELSLYARRFQAWQSYSSSAVQALDSLASKQPPTPIAAADARKVCDGPSGDSDRIEVEGPESNTVAVLLAEASFDQGGRELITLRRVGNTNRWTGRIDWPAAGTRANLRVRWPGTSSWFPVRSALETRRQSQTTNLADANRAVKQIVAKFKDTNFRAVGGDTVKTHPVF